MPAPVSASEFARALAAFEPFEPGPLLATGVSGGADSLALTLLADDWARARGGRVVGLTVDHGLRPDSAGEAAEVGRRLARFGIEHHVLHWPAPHPSTNLQAAARDARYRLLARWCAQHAVLHLLTAHHRDDQAETLLLRLARGSGLVGLAGMAGVVELAQIRLLRPLLAVPPERLRATLLGRGIDWIEDPSNRDPRFARSRLRGAHAALDRLGLTVPRLAAAAGHAGRARAALEASLDQLLAAAVGLDPAGVALIDPDTFLAAPRELRLRLLSAVLTAIGGRVHPPRFEQLERLEAALCGDPAGPGRTLLGCRMIRQRGRWLVFREARGVAAPLDLPAGRPVCWDGRFLATATGGEGQRIGAFALADEAEREAIAGWRPAPHLPRIAWPSLPGLWQDDRLVSVPHLGWSIGGPPIQVTLRFRPLRPVSGAGFVAGSGRGAIGD